MNQLFKCTIQSAAKDTLKAIFMIAACAIFLILGVSFIFFGILFLLSLILEEISLLAILLSIVSILLSAALLIYKNYLKCGGNRFLRKKEDSI